MSQDPPSSENIAELVRRFREMKHASVNTLSVVLALGEMTRKNPVHLDRMCEVVQERLPDLIEQLNQFGIEFRQFAEDECGLNPEQLRPREDNQ